MPLLEDLRRGTFGVRLSPPGHLRIERDEPAYARLVDKGRGIEWNLSFGSGNHMDIGETHLAHLKRSIDWTARGMFDQVFEQHAEENADTTEPPGPLAPKRRTEDPTWSPVVEVEPLTVGGAAALRHVHRMMYLPGREIVMGHLLVPLPDGLFEARALAVDRETGSRECVVLLTEQSKNPARFAEDPIGGLRQADYDNPSLDATFPDHALSRSRQALRDLAEHWQLHVDRHAPAPEHREIALPQFACAITPPPRFIRHPTMDDGTQNLAFIRVSFCNTDGIDYFFVARHRARRPASELLTEAADRARAILIENGVKEITLTVSELPPVEGRRHALVIGEGTGHIGRLRSAFRCFIDERGHFFQLCIAGNTAAVPGESMAADLDETARSWRPIGAPDSVKPWWKIW